jgi:hypothetical protein
MKAYRGSSGIAPLIHKFGKYVDEDKWSSSGPRPLNLEKKNPIMRGWLGLRAGLSILEKKTPLAGTVNRTPDYQFTDYATPGSNSLEYKEKSNSKFYLR